MDNINIQTYPDGLTTLVAKNNFGYNIQPVELSNIFFYDSNIVDTINIKAPKSARFYYLCYQIKKNGFIENPLPLYIKDNVIRYVGGMLRLKACVELKYSVIDSIVLSNIEEIEKLIQQQRMMTKEYFPKHLLEETEKYPMLNCTDNNAHPSVTKFVNN